MLSFIAFLDEENDLEPYGWGLGFRVLMNNTQQNLYGTVGEFGWSGYASTYFMVDPLNKISAVSNVGGSPGRITL